MLQRNFFFFSLESTFNPFTLLVLNICQICVHLPTPAVYKWPVHPWVLSSNSTSLPPLSGPLTQLAVNAICVKRRLDHISLLLEKFLWVLDVTE